MREPTSQCSLQSVVVCIVGVVVQHYRTKDVGVRSWLIRTTGVDSRRCDRRIRGEDGLINILREEELARLTTHICNAGAPACAQLLLQRQVVFRHIREAYMLRLRTQRGARIKYWVLWC